MADELPRPEKRYGVCHAGHIGAHLCKSGHKGDKRVLLPDRQKQDGGRVLCADGFYARKNG